MPREILTDEQVELEIERLLNSDDVKLAKKGNAYQASQKTVYVQFTHDGKEG